MTAEFALSKQRIFDTIDATWAPARIVDHGPFRIRVGKGGGSRVSSASLHESNATEASVRAASDLMRENGQAPLFMIRPGEEALDQLLDGMGFQIGSPTVVFSGPTADMAEHAPKGIATIGSDFPMAIHRALWLDAEIGPERISVMNRVSNPKAYFLGRFNEQAAGTVFVATDGASAMLHALYISPFARNNGVGQNLTFACAKWALSCGADTLLLLTTTDNSKARSLYSKIGMREVSQYHYRILTE